MGPRPHFLRQIGQHTFVFSTIYTSLGALTRLISGARFIARRPGLEDFLTGEDNMKKILAFAALTALVASGCSSNRGASNGSFETYDTGGSTSAPVHQDDVRQGPTSSSGMATPSVRAADVEIEPADADLPQHEIDPKTPGGGSSTGRSFDPASNTNNAPDNLTGDDQEDKEDADTPDDDK